MPKGLNIESDFQNVQDPQVLIINQVPNLVKVFEKDQDPHAIKHKNIILKLTKL